MAGDLERFLQQAAERLKQKMEQGNKPRPAPQPTKQPPPVRQAERVRQTLESAPVHGEIVEAKLAGQQPELGPNPLSNIDTRSHGPTDVDYADERMSGHLQEVFDHDVMQLQKASSALGGGAGQSGKGSQVTTRQHDVSPLVQMLRNPATLRSAFIASEIFARKF